MYHRRLSCLGNCVLFRVASKRARAHVREKKKEKDREREKEFVSAHATQLTLNSIEKFQNPFAELLRDKRKIPVEMLKRFLIKCSAARVGEIKENNFDSAAGGNRGAGGGTERRRARGMKCCCQSFASQQVSSYIIRILTEEAISMPQFRRFFLPKLKFSEIYVRILSFVEQFREIVPCTLARCT